ncbi:hypothetical protein [Microlunatus sp. GCM10028923]|uniref:hypothetical protein n=1 Tax=Microlunatus sp. GCM10028923 TaxID=3273400 RepID=UPI00361A77AD
MPFLGEIRISGPTLVEDETFVLTDAVLAAIKDGWQVPLVVKENDSTEDSSGEGGRGRCSARTPSDYLDALAVGVLRRERKSVSL